MLCYELFISVTSDHSQESDVRTHSLSKCEQIYVKP